MFNENFHKLLYNMQNIECIKVGYNPLTILIKVFLTSPKFLINKSSRNRKQYFLKKVLN